MKLQHRAVGHRKVRLGHLGVTGVIGALALMQSVGPVSAQTTNPATSVEQQNALRLEELTATTPQSGPVIISPDAASAQIAPPGGPTVLLTRVAFSPASAFLTQAELDAILAKYVGRRVDFSQIQRLVQDVNDLYTRKGVITASAILPPQTLDRGLLKVELVEGKLASVSVSGNKRVPDTFVLGRVRLTTGNNTVDVPSAAEDITRFNKVYSAQLRMSLQPGATFGTTDLALELTEPKTNQLSFFVDNQGVASTGTYQMGVFYHRYSLLMPDDNLVAYGTLAEGSISGTVSYDVPITPLGTRLGLSYSRSAIKVVSGPSEPLNITGSSQSIGATLNHPFYVSPTWSVFGTAGASYGTSESFSNTTPLVDSATQRYSVGLTATFTNEKMAFSISPQVSFAVADDYLEPSTRDITLFTGSFNGTYQLDNGIALTANGAWQLTGTQLLPGDLLFQIGGPSTVRGFPSDAAAGDSGIFAQFEAHKSVDIEGLAKGIDFYGFVDVGAVYSTFPEQVFLLSAGGGMAYPLSDNAKLELGVGVPINQAVANQAPATIYGRLTMAAF